jgi:hypothetical protein
VPPPEEHAGNLPPPMIGGSAAGAEVYWYSAKRIGSALPIIPFVKFELSQNLVLDLHFPIAIAIDGSYGKNGDSKSVTGLGNPTAGLTYFSTENRLTWHVGGRISAPLAGASDEAEWQNALLVSGISSVLWDVHYWQRKFLPIGGRVGFEYIAPPKNNLAIRGGLEPAIFIPLGDDDLGGGFTVKRKTGVWYQLRIEGEYLGESGWGGGLGLQLVHQIAGTDADDSAQGAFEPFLGYHGSSMFMRLGYLIALDSPLGFGLDSGLLKVATVRLAIGAKF